MKPMFSSGGLTLANIGPYLLNLHLGFNNNRLMATNQGVDTKSIETTKNIKNMWENTIQKKKLEVESSKVIGINKTVSSPVKQMETKQVHYQPLPQATQNQTSSVNSNQATAGSNNQQQVPSPTKYGGQTLPQDLGQKSQSAVDTQGLAGMTVKDRMKLWQQLKSQTKEVSTPAPIQKPLQISKPPSITEPSPPITQPAFQPGNMFVNPNSVASPEYLLVNIQKQQSDNPYKQGQIQETQPGSNPTLANTVPKQPQTLNTGTSQPGRSGIQTNFVPASNKIKMWENMLVKNKVEVQRAKQADQLITKTVYRNTYQPQTSTSPVDDLEDIIGVREEPPTLNFIKKNSEDIRQAVDQQPVMSIKDRMKAMQQTLEKTLKHTQPGPFKTVSATDAIATESPVNIGVPVQDPQAIGIKLPNPSSEQDSHHGDQSQETTTPVQTTQPQNTFEQDMLTRQKRMKNKRTKNPSFDDEQ